MKTKKLEKNFSQTHAFVSVWKLYHRYFWKSFTGPFFAFGFPVIVYLIVGPVFGWADMLPAIIASIGATQGMYSMPISIMALKESVLMKRIGASPVKTATFTLVVVAYSLIVCLFASFFMLVVGLICKQDTDVLGKLFDSAQNFFTFFYGYTINGIVGILIGFLIASVSKNSMQAMLFALLAFFPCTFLTGQYFSAALIRNSDFFNGLARILPFRYTTMDMLISWKGQNPFDSSDSFRALVPTTGETLTLFDEADYIMSYFYPYIFIALPLVLSIKFFKWSAKR